MTHAWVGQARALLTTPPQKGAIGVLGDLGLDKYVFGAVDRVSPEAPVLVLRAEREELRLGCAANVVRNLAELSKALPLRTGVYGISGDDQTADQLNAKIEDLPGLEDVAILRDASRPTMLKTRYVAGSHHQLLRCDTESTAPVRSSLQADLRSRLQSAPHHYGVLIVEDYGKGLLDAAWLSEIFADARAKGIMVMVDPNRNTPPEAYRGADLITPNVLEAETLLGRSLKKGAVDSDAESAAREIQQRLQIKNVVLKRSAYGMTLLEESGRVHHVPTQAKEVFDVTGAGDTVIATLAAAKVLGADLVTAAYLANLAAGIVVGKVGAATVSSAELLTALSDLS